MLMNNGMDGFMKLLLGNQSIEQYIAESQAAREALALVVAQSAAAMVVNAQIFASMILPRFTPEMAAHMRLPMSEQSLAFVALAAQASQTLKPFLDACLEDARQRQLMSIEEADAGLRESFGVGIEDYMREDEPCQIQEMDTTA
jgi:hypothetical protein